MTSTPVDSAQERILKATCDLLEQGGRSAVSTRAVSAAAGVQPQTIYRQFGDMAGLLDAAAQEGFRRYLGSKSSAAFGADPVADLRAGWDLHIDFGVNNPALYLLMYGEPDSRRQPEAARQTQDILRNLLEAAARAGRLRMDVDAAASLIHALGIGVVISAIGNKAEADTGLSERVRELAIEAITTEGARESSGAQHPDDDAARHAIALRSLVPAASSGLTPGESLLLDELLARVAKAGAAPSTNAPSETTPSDTTP